MENVGIARDGHFDPTEENIRNFQELGYLLIQGLLNDEETRLLRTALENDPNLRKNTYDKVDDEDHHFAMVLWNKGLDDVTGYVARSEKVVSTFEKLLQKGELYHYHSKVTMKPPHEGGAFVWHQDYGYWYNFGFLLPDMGTVYVAIDSATKENGCLKIIPRSHNAGKVDHREVAGQVQADPERVHHLLQRFGVVHVEMEAGDTLFFHSNLLHRSDKNGSDTRRWAFLIAYNSAANSPIEDFGHPQYERMEKVPNSEIAKRAARTRNYDNTKCFYDSAANRFMDPTQ